MKKDEYSVSFDAKKFLMDYYYTLIALKCKLKNGTCDVPAITHVLQISKDKMNRNWSPASS